VDRLRGAVGRSQPWHPADAEGLLGPSQIIEMTRYTLVTNRDPVPRRPSPVRGVLYFVSVTGLSSSITTVCLSLFRSATGGHSQRREPQQSVPGSLDLNSYRTPKVRVAHFET
jgi:hypothetical protein